MSLRLDRSVVAVSGWSISMYSCGGVSDSVETRCRSTARSTSPASNPSCRTTVPPEASATSTAEPLELLTGRVDRATMGSGDWRATMRLKLRRLYGCMTPLGRPLVPLV